MAAGIAPRVTDFEGFKALALELLDGWDAYANTGDEVKLGQRGKKVDLARFISVWGLSNHVHRLGPPAMRMMEDGLAIESFPLIRAMYEGALTAVWLAQNTDAAAAFVNRETDSRAALADTLAKAQEPWFRDRADDFRGDLTKMDSASNAQAKHFEQLCNDLNPGGADAYVHYRLLSRYSHAAPEIVDRYVMLGDGESPPTLRTVPNDVAEIRGLGGFYLTSSLVWAGAATDYIDPNRQRRSETRRAAKAIGIPRDLHLTAAAIRRTRKKR